MLGILKSMCELINDQQAGRKFDSKIKWPASILNHETQKAEDYRADSVGANQSNENVLDCFRSSTNIEANKEASRSIIQNIHSDFSDDLTGIGCFEAYSVWGWKRATTSTRPCGVCTTAATQRETRQVAETADNCTTGCRWYIILVLKANGKVQLCLAPARPNKVLIRPVQRDWLPMTFCPGWRVPSTLHSLMQS